MVRVPVIIKAVLITTHEPVTVSLAAHTSRTVAVGSTGIFVQLLKIFNNLRTQCTRHVH